MNCSSLQTQFLKGCANSKLLFRVLLSVNTVGALLHSKFWVFNTEVCSLGHLSFISPWSSLTMWSRTTSEPPGQVILLRCTLQPNQLIPYGIGWSNMSESPSLVPPHCSPPPLQVLIPSVKLDYSHVQSRCGSLDRRGYSAGGGNVSLVPQVHCLSVCVVWCFSVSWCQCFLLHIALASRFTVSKSRSPRRSGLCPARIFFFYHMKGWRSPPPVLYSGL